MKPGSLLHASILAAGMLLAPLAASADAGRIIILYGSELPSHAQHYPGCGHLARERHHHDRRYRPDPGDRHYRHLHESHHGQGGHHGYETRWQHGTVEVVDGKGYDRRRFRYAGIGYTGRS